MAVHVGLEIRGAPAERAAEMERWGRDLAALADERRLSVTDWLQSARLDAQSIAGARRTEQFVHGGPGENGEASPAVVTELLDRFARPRGDALAGLWIVGADGSVMASDSRAPPPDAACREAAAKADPAGRVGDIHGHDSVPVIPVAASVGASGASALYAFAARPLFSRLARRATQPSTLESYLVRGRDGRLEFLSPLLFGQPAAGAFDDPRLGARAAAEGRDTFGEGLDYRVSAENTVLTVTRAIPGTDWGLAVEVDVSEALAPLRERVRARRMLAIGIWIGILGMAYGVARAQRAALTTESARVAAHYVALIDEANDALVVLDERGHVVEANRRATEFYGRSQDELIGLHVREVLPPAARAETDRRVAQVLKEGTGLFEAVHVRPDGTTFPVEVSARLVTGSGGERSVVVVVRDVTARREADEKARETETWFRTFIEKAPLAIGLSRGGMGVYANEMFLELWRYPSNDHVVGRSVLEHWTPEARPLIADRVRRRALGLPTLPDDVLALRSDGTTFPAHVETVAVELPDGPVTAAFITDETERKRAEEALVAKDAAEQASRAKSSFLAHVSHEIRTPMNAVLGYAQLLLRDDALGQSQKQKVEVIHSSGTHLLQVLNDVLEMSKIEAGRASLTVAPFDLRATLGEVESMFRVLTATKGIGLEVECDAAVPRGLEADGGKVKQIILNLLSNAVKFTESGKITMRASCTLAGADRPMVRAIRIAVQDTGIGIDAEGLGRLFQAFEQLTAGAKIGGTGLGLAISRNLAQLMRGDVTVESTPGAGSLFTFTFEAEVADLPSAVRGPRRVPVRIAGDQPPPKILVVDDIATNRDLCRELLSRVGFETRDASNGEEALAVHETWHPDLVLMDLRMPGMNGFDATRRLRSSGSKARIVALTASGLSDAEPDALGAGADLFLRKPYDERDLLRRIGELLGLRYEYEAVFETSPSGAPQRPALSQLVRELPADLVRELREAATAARARRIEELATRVSEHSEAAAAAIGDLMRLFRYDLILAALDGASEA